MSNKPESLVFADDRPSSLDDTLYQWATDAEEMIREMQKHIDDLNKENSSLKKDAARWKEVAFGSNPFLGVFYVDSFGNEIMLCGLDAVGIVDESIKIYMQKD